MDYKNVLFKIHGTICNLALLMRNTSVVFNSTANDPCLWQHLINHAVAQKMRIVNLKAQASVSRYRVLFRSINWIFMSMCRTLYVHMLTGGASHVATFNRSLHYTYTQDILKSHLTIKSCSAPISYWARSWIEVTHVYYADTISLIKFGY